MQKGASFRTPLRLCYQHFAFAVRLSDRVVEVVGLLLAVQVGLRLDVAVAVVRVGEGLEERAVALGVAEALAERVEEAREFLPHALAVGDGDFLAVASLVAVASLGAVASLVALRRPRQARP